MVLNTVLNRKSKAPDLSVTIDAIRDTTQDVVRDVITGSDQGGGLPSVSLPSSSALGAYQRENANSAWSWHINDVVLYDAATDRTYRTSTEIPGGAQFVNIHDRAGVYQSRVQVNDGFIADDHNAPALTFFEGVLYCAYAGHNDDDNVYVQVSTDTTPENLGNEVTIVNGNDSTYAQFVVLDDRLYLVSRSGTQTWKLHRLVSGNTWETLPDILTSARQTYLNIQTDGTNLRFVAWDHPTDAGSSIQGEIKVREFAPGDPSVDITTLPTIFDAGTNRSTRVLSVTPDASVIAFVDFPVADLTDQTYKIARFSGSGSFTDPAQWTPEDIGTNAYTFYSNSNYVPGVHLANASGTEAWKIEGQASGYCEMYHGTFDGSTWTFNLVAASITPLVRPVSDQYTRGQVFVQRLSAYTDFRDADVSAYSIYTGDNIGIGGWVEPMPLVPGILYQETYRYITGTDISVWEFPVDLTAAVPGATLGMIDIYRSVGGSAIASDMFIGGIEMQEFANVAVAPMRSYVRTLPYTPGMDNTVRHVADDTAAYQITYFFILEPGMTLVDSGDVVDALVDDLIVSLGFSRDQAGITHVHTPASAQRQEAYGGGLDTIVSYGAGVSPADVQPNITGFGPEENVQNHAVFRGPSAPAFSQQPLIIGTPEVGQTLTIDIGVAAPGTVTYQITEFSLDGVDKRGELVGLDWDTTGEDVAAGGLINLRVSATNAQGTTLSDVITATLTEAPVGAVISIDKDEATDTFTITTDSENDGNYVIGITTDGGTLTSDEAGGFNEATELEATMAVGASGASMAIPTTDLTEGDDYEIFVYQVNGSGVESNLVTVGFTLNSSGTTLRADDTNALLWLKASGVTVDGSNNVTSWADESNGANGDNNLDIVPTGANAPTFNVDRVQFRGNEALVSGVDFTTPLASLSGSQILQVLIVADVSVNNSDRRVLAGMKSTQLDASNAGRSAAFGYDTSAGNRTDSYHYARRFADGAGSSSAVTAATSVVAPGKMLLEWRISPTEETFHINGDQVYPDPTLDPPQPVPTIPGNFPNDANTRFSVGGRGREDGAARFANADLYETFITVVPDAAAADALQVETRTEHGL